MYFQENKNDYQHFTNTDYNYTQNLFNYFGAEGALGILAHMTKFCILDQEPIKSLIEG